MLWAYEKWNYLEKPIGVGTYCTTYNGYYTGNDDGEFKRQFIQRPADAAATVTLFLDIFARLVIEATHFRRSRWQSCCQTEKGWHCIAWSGNSGKISGSSASRSVSHFFQKVLSERRLRINYNFYLCIFYSWQSAKKKYVFRVPKL